MNILFTCNHRGGANALLPIVKASKKISKNYLVVTSPLNSKLFKKENIPIKIIKNKINKKEVIEIIKKFKPSIIVTGTSETEDLNIGRLECLFNAIAKAHGIYALSILDFCTRYKERYSLNKRNLLDAVPNKICVMNSKIKKEMINLGFDKNIISITGNPHLDEIKKYKYSKNEIDFLKKKLNINNNTKVFMFISQPISERIRKNEFFQKFKYDEKKVLEDIINVIYLYKIKKSCRHVKLIIKTHPSEDKKKFIVFKKKYSNLNIQILNSNYNIFNVAKFSDYIIGMFSMLLLEISYYSPNVIYYQPTFKRNLINLTNNRISTSRNNLLKRIRINANKKINKKINNNSTEKILNIIKRNHSSYDYR
jgi:hypothetical protein